MRTSRDNKTEKKTKSTEEIRILQNKTFHKYFC